MYFGVNQNIKILDQSLFSYLFLSKPVPIFCQQIFISYSKVPFWHEYYTFFQQIAGILKVNLPPDFSNYPRFLVRLVNKNKFFKGALVKIVFFPQKNNFVFIAIPQKVDFERFSLFKNKIIILKKHFKIKPGDDLNFVRSYSLHHYNIIKENAANKPALVYNDSGEVLENQLGNFLLIEQNNVYSPNYQVGAYFNAIQQKVLDILSKMGYKIFNQTFNFSKFESASEVWIIAQDGIYVRVGIDTLRYHYSDLSERVFDKLMELYDKEDIWL